MCMILLGLVLIYFSYLIFTFSFFILLKLTKTILIVLVTNNHVFWLKYSFKFYLSGEVKLKKLINE